MDPKLQKELEDFNIKKEFVFKNIQLLNNLSESLVNSIADEEQCIKEKKKKDIIENEKRKTANELELLGIENSKMESYLDILSKKQDLELKYLEQMCEQRARIHKLGEKYSFLDIESFIPYETNYKQNLINTKNQFSNKKNVKKVTNENIIETEKKEPEQLSNNRSYQSEENCSQANNQSDFDLVDSNCKENKNPPTPEPPPPPPKRRLTISSPQGISERIPPKKFSLEDQLKSALASKFAVPVDGKNDNYDSDDSSSNWT